MIDYTPFYHALEKFPLSRLFSSVPAKVQNVFSSARWGDLPRWMDALAGLPSIKPSIIDLNADCLQVGRPEDVSEKQRLEIETCLRGLHPWRKGPFNVFGITIDTEWRSDMKWNRLKNHIAPLKDRCVLDIGAGSGYHCWRMIGAGARLVVGIDPVLLYPIQFQAVQHFIQNENAAVLPVGIDDLPCDIPFFDTIFSMGLLYHRRSPLDHLFHLKSFLRDGGQLVLETLVIDGKQGDVLSPAGRYAKMPNVRFIPSCPTLQDWLKRCGFDEIDVVDISATTSEEQRSTGWMRFQSLRDFLHPEDRQRTIEGYPAPVRATFLARKAKIF